MFGLDSVTSPARPDKSTSGDVLDDLIRRAVVGRVRCWTEMLSDPVNQLLRVLTGETTSVQLVRDWNVHPKTINRRVADFRARAAHALRELAP